MAASPSALFDISVLIDAVTGGLDANGDSLTALTLVSQGLANGFISGSSVDNLGDLLIRNQGSERARDTLIELRHMLAIATVDAQVVDAAIAVKGCYFDDAMTHACASVHGIQYLVTLNPEDFPAHPVTVMGPGEFIRHLTSRGEPMTISV